MQALREITQWQGVNRQPNHIYLLDGDRVKAYIKFGEGPVEWLSGKIKIDRRGRKFEPADMSLFEAQAQVTSLIEIKGSKGGSYFLDPDAGSCTCPGFTFRGTCKHLKELA
jgi:hypothetical protein